MRRTGEGALVKTTVADAPDAIVRARLLDVPPPPVAKVLSDKDGKRAEEEYLV